MSTVKELMLSPDGTLFEPLDVPDDGDEPQAAAVRPTTAATPAQPNRRKGRNVPWPCERECPTPSLLLRTRIPRPLSPEPIGMIVRETIQHPAPIRHHMLDPLALSHQAPKAGRLSCRAKARHRSACSA